MVSKAVLTLAVCLFAQAENPTKPSTAKAQSKPLSRAELAARLAPIFAAPPATGLVVFAVEPGSQAEREGVAIGDVVTHYNGQSVADTITLSKLAREAITAKQRPILVSAIRAGQELSFEFDPAPMGLRFASIRKEQATILEHPPTLETLDLGPLFDSSRGRDFHFWDLVYTGDNPEPAGWEHHYVTRLGDRILVRIQSYRNDAGRRDAIVTFDQGSVFAIRSIQLAVDNKLILSLAHKDGTLTGERVGVPVSMPLEKETLSAHVSGLAAMAFPRQEGACLSCAFLDDASLSAAPLAQLICRESTADGAVIDLLAFGEPAIRYRLSADGQIRETIRPGGYRSLRVPAQAVQERFADSLKQFEPIERLPVHQAPKAN